MRRGRWVMGAAVGLGTIWCAGTMTFAENAASLAPSETPALSAEEEAHLAALLDRVVENDQQISARLDAMISELQIVKTRATIKRRTNEDND